MNCSEVIFGVRLDSNITPILVRDAIINCYLKADDEVLEEIFNIREFETDEQKQKLKEDHVRVIIKKVFYDADGDFDNPTKETLIDVINGLRDFASHFRDKETIEENYNMIMKLIDKLE